MPTKKYAYQDHNPLQFHERVQLWKEQKELKIQESRKKDENKDLKSCTFQPTMVKFKDLIKLFISEGYFKF